MTASTSNTQESHLLGQFIPLHYHYQMLLDDTRMSGFKAAIEALTPAGGTVLELGGGTGVLSWFAAQSAHKVICVERNPEMVRSAKRFLSVNPGGERVTVVEADATEYTPPFPVDVVVCEMLHSALLREKQTEVIEAFKENYRRSFPSSALPKFIPEATILAVQAVEQSFDFYGYQAPLPMFFPPEGAQDRTRQLGEPAAYSMFEYRNQIGSHFSFNGELPVTSPGTVNALRFVTKNVLAILLDKHTTIDWHNFYLVLPIPQPIVVQSPAKLHVSFSYSAGASLDSLSQSLSVTPLR